MRPSRLFLYLSFCAVLFALLAVATPFIATKMALLPFGLLLVMALLDALISIHRRHFILEHHSKKEVFIGEEAVLHFKLNLKKSAPLHMQATLPPSEGFSSLSFFALNKGESHISLTAQRRGTWHFDKLWLTWRSRLRLLDFINIHAFNTTINIVPNIRIITSNALDIQLRSSLHGAKQTTWRGEGSEFHQMNEYVNGMDPRSIDWKRSARKNTLLAREMQAERNHQIIIALDNGHLMREKIEGLSKIDHTINAALALAWAGVQGGDQVGLFAFDARPRLYSPPKSGRNGFAHIRSQMAQLQYKSIETNHTLAFSHLHQKLSKRSLIVVFSDFVDPLTAELLVEHVSILNRHHVVIFVSLKDPLLEELTTTPASTMNEVTRSVSAANHLAERRSVLDKMATQGIYVIEANVGTVTAQLINTYLAIKAKEEI